MSLDLLTDGPIAETKNLSSMKEGNPVSMNVADDEQINGICIEDECAVVDSSKRVVRVRWEDGSESIENVNELF